MKRTISFLLIVAMIFTGITSVSAAETKKIIADLSRDCVITVDGKTKTIKDSKDNALYPIKFNNTTYLPISSVKVADGKEVTWGENKSATLKAKEIEITVLSDYALVVDGKTKSVKDKSGNVLHPIKYNGTIYLTASIIKSATGKTIVSDATKKKITINSIKDNSASKTKKKKIGGTYKDENMKVVTPLSEMDKFTVFWGNTGDKVHISPDCHTFKNGVLFGTLEDCKAAGHTKGWCGKCSSGRTDEGFKKSGNPFIP